MTTDALIPVQDHFLIDALKFHELVIFVLSTTTVTFLIGLFLWDKYQKKRTILRNFPIIGHFRYIFEFLG